LLSLSVSLLCLSWPHMGKEEEPSGCCTTVDQFGTFEGDLTVEPDEGEIELRRWRATAVSFGLLTVGYDTTVLTSRMLWTASVRGAYFLPCPKFYAIEYAGWSPVECVLGVRLLTLAAAVGGQGERELRRGAQRPRRRHQATAPDAPRPPQGHRRRDGMLLVHLPLVRRPPMARWLDGWLTQAATAACRIHTSTLLDIAIDTDARWQPLADVLAR